MIVEQTKRQVASILRARMKMLTERYQHLSLITLAIIHKDEDFKKWDNEVWRQHDHVTFVLKNLWEVVYEEDYEKLKTILHAIHGCT